MGSNSAASSNGSPADRSTTDRHQACNSPDEFRPGQVSFLASFDESRYAFKVIIYQVNSELFKCVTEGCSVYGVISHS